MAKKSKPSKQNQREAVISLWFEANVKEYSQEADALVRDEVGPTLKKLEKVEGVGLDQYRLTQEGCGAIIGLLKEVKNSKATRLQAAKVTILPSEEERENALWHVIWPAAIEIEVIGSSKGLLNIRADRVKGRLPLRRYVSHMLVSDSFVAWTKAQGLTGLEFLRCVDKGKYAAEQWHLAIASAFLGRGIDHEWFDPATRGEFKDQGFLEVQPTKPEWIMGVRSFGLKQVRDGIKTEPRGLGELLSELKVVKSETDHRLRVQAPVEVLKAFTPQSDFAYVRVAGAGTDAARGVRLCCNKATREKMIQARMAKPDDFEPVLVRESAGDAEVFDRKGEPIQNQFTAGELKKVRDAEAEFLAKARSSPKQEVPGTGPEISKVMPKVKRRVKAQGPVTAGATKEELTKTGVKLAIPARWGQLLAEINGFEIDEAGGFDGDGVRIAGTQGLAEAHKQCVKMAAIGWPNMPKTYLGVGSTGNGDCLFLDTGKVTKDGDCPVVHVDHETCTVAVTWPAIGIFLLEVVEREKE